MAASGRAGTVATLSVCQYLAGLVSRDLASDLGSVKADYLARSRAQATKDCAKAEQAVTQAAAAANAVIHAQERHDIEMDVLRSQARIEKARARVADAVAEGIVEGVNHREPAWVEAAEKFEDTVRRLRSKGGALLISRGELAKQNDAAASEASSPISQENTEAQG